MTKIEIKNRWTGSILFEYSKENNTIKETVIEAVNGTDEGFLYEASDLIYHLIVLLTSKGYSLDDLGRELKKRHK